jgi:cell division transport system ATP-binding protein
MSTPFCVELKDVDRDFPRAGRGDDASGKVLQALARVSLRLKSGEFVFLTGASGSGKTTLLRLILGLDRPSAGEVITLGRATHQLSETDRRTLRRQIGIVFQDHRLLPSLTVRENVELPLQLLGLGTKERERRILEVLETVQMLSHAGEKPTTLSAGEKSRVGIARALVTCPALIVADEPTGNLDPATARSIVRLLRDLKGHGTTVLIATHDMGLVRDFGGRVLELVGGALPLQEPNRLSKAYRVPRFWDGSVAP